MQDKPVSRCPECRHKVRRLLGAGAGLIFKGSGFYSTDYRSAGYKTAAKAEQGAAKGGAGAGKESDKKTVSPGKKTGGAQAGD